MLIKKTRQLLIILVFCLIFFFPKESFAQENIKVSGFNHPRNFFALITPTGAPPPYSYYSSTLYGNIKNASNFGQGGVVKCSVNFEPFVNSINTSSLVDENGKPKVDIFFAGLSTIFLTDTEANELKNFMEAGGILYISGFGGSSSQGAPWGWGIEYNLLFQKLGLIDHFTELAMFPGPYVLSAQVQNSFLQNGPFTPIYPFKHGSYREFTNNSLTGVATAYDSTNYIALEKKIGKGYLFITSDVLYRNDLMLPNMGNLTYFLNLFALPCQSEEPATVLNVPSFKQTDPNWQNAIYDDGNKQTLWCGDTIGDCGCAMTSASMVVGYFGINNDSFGNLINPYSLNNYFSQNSQKIENIYSSWGYYFGNFNWYQVDNYTALAKRVFSLQPELDQPTREDFNLLKIKEYIDSGKPVILRVIRPGGFIHWVVVKGYQGDNLIINDPARPDPSEGFQTLASLNYTPDITNSVITYQVTNSDFRSIEFFSTLPFTIETPSESLNANFEPEVESTGNTGSYYLSIKLPEDGKYKIISPENNKVAVYSSDKLGGSMFYIFNNEEFIYDSQNNEKLQVEVNINVRPHSFFNFLNFKSNMILPVSILSNKHVSPKNINQDSLKLKIGDEESTYVKCQKHPFDLNFDGSPDLICLFRIKKTNFKYPKAEATLTGETTNHLLFLGKDAIISL